MSRSQARFVDPSGSDSNSGLTPAAAWATMAKVSAATDLEPGDCVLLKRGSRWRERLKIDAANVNGKVGAPIRIGAYGSGEDPIVSASEVIPTSGWSAAVSPTVAETFISDSFTRSDSASDLGSAATGTDSSKTWVQVDAGYFGISSNRGIANRDFGTQRASIGDSDHDGSLDLQIDFVGIPSASGANQGCALWGRMTSGFGAGYQVQYLRNTTTLQVRKWASGSASSPLDTATVSALANATIRVQIIVVPTGQQIRARIWETGTTEPGTWDIDYTDESSPRTTGGFGISAENNTAAANVSFDNLICRSYVPLYTATFSRTLTTDPVRILVEDGVGLTLAASADAVELTAGSYFWTSNTLYLHATDGSNPSSSGKVYEAATRTSSVWVLSADAVVVEDVVVEHGTLYGLIASGGAYQPEVRRVTSRLTSQYGIFASDADGGACYAPWVHDCEVSDNKQYAGIGVHSSGGDAIVEGNGVSDCGLDSFADHGIYLLANGDGVIVARDNLVSGAAAYGIKSGQFLTASQVYRNITRDCGRGGYICDASSSSGSGARYWHNVDYGSRWGLTLWAQTGHAAQVDECKNNIFFNNTERGVNLTGQTESDDGWTLDGFEANCVFGAPQLYHGMADPTGSDGNIDDDPLFVDAEGGDFHLGDGSPCIDAGVDVPGVTVGVPDIGVYASEAA